MAYPYFCTEANAGVVAVVVGVVLMVGIFVSYCVQMLSIWRSGSSAGLSTVSLAIGLFSSLLTAVNHFVLRWDNIICCGSLDPSQCLALNLAGEQLLIGPIGQFFLFILVLWYFDFEPTAKETVRQRRVAYYGGVGMFLGVMLLATLSAVIAYLMYYVMGIPGENVFTYADVLGIVATLCTVIMWCPQIFVTIRSKSAGSLSLGMLCLQAPGAVACVINMAIIQEEKWTTWAPYVAMGVQQTILIILCIVYMVRDRRLGRYGKYLSIDDDEEEEEEEANKTPKSPNEADRLIKKSA